ncbi:hypothetical protein Ahy_A02g009018 isoform A [Arachis hypogaea]|uniref:Uncharacterized protein n=1 Tax=Arachis hypogaea TaxID=3818 RepID=A0A445EG86_ARAHY|nr:hypothetical protein Ahy_A02g009018 isoform A [Arachis hypogaea]
MAVLNRRFHTYIKQKNCNPSLIKRNTVTALSISLLSPSSPPCSDSAVLPSRLLLSPPVTISLGTSPSPPVLNERREEEEESDSFGQQLSLANSVRWLQIQTSTATDLRSELKELIPEYQELSRGTKKEEDEH